MSPKRERDPETGLPIISTPNGKRWAWDTISKYVVGVLLLITVAVWSRALLIYGLPPRVDAAEQAIGQLQMQVIKRQPMTQVEIDAIGAAVWAAKPSPAPRKGK